MPDPEALVREIARGIEPGTVLSYGQIGRIAGLNPRHVGRIVGRIAAEIPWWRVVRADGVPATCHAGAAPALLRAEGVPFRGEAVDMARAAGGTALSAGGTAPSAGEDAGR